MCFIKIYQVFEFSALILLRSSFVLLIIVVILSVFKEPVVCFSSDYQCMPPGTMLRELFQYSIKDIVRTVFMVGLRIVFLYSLFGFNCLYNVLLSGYEKIIKKNSTPDSFCFFWL